MRSMIEMHGLKLSESIGNQSNVYIVGIMTELLAAFKTAGVIVEVMLKLKNGQKNVKDGYYTVAVYGCDQNTAVDLLQCQWIALEPLSSLVCTLWCVDTKLLSSRQTPLWSPRPGERLPNCLERFIICGQNESARQLCWIICIEIQRKLRGRT